MKNKSWIIPVTIIAINALAIAVRWCSLPEILPAHFDLEGNASGTMPRAQLLLFPLIAAAICMAAYFIAQKKHKLQKGIVILASGICLILLLSTMVTLTYGTMPVFMLAEPVVLAAAIVGFVICTVKAKKR